MTGNVSKQKREKLLEKIKEIHKYISSAPQDENTGKLLAYLSDLEKDVNGKKYGLVFEEHREEIEEVLEENTPVLTEDKDLFIDNCGQMNFLIEGDNLASLKLLEKTHKGKIGCIYIDPPYNRGKDDFIYNDNFVVSEDGYRHSKWLSFMSKKLRIAKTLLRDDGLIFISIDDCECAQLKVLCDDVFGENNFINMFIWQRNSSGKTEKEKFTVNTEYILLYSKSKKYQLNEAYKPLSDGTKAMYSKNDNDGRGNYRLYPLQKPGSPGPETTYDYIDNNGKVWLCPAKGWRIKQSKLKALENDGRLYLEGKSLSVKAYWNERISEGKRVDALWNDLPENSSASKEIEQIFGKKGVFNNPKPTDLIKRCIKIAPKDSTVLDFFVGSGTTAQAVLELNKEDNENRKFIVCTNNENNICREVTYERIKRVIDKENYAASLKYFKVDFVPIKERMYYEYADKLLLHIRELVELENGINFNKNSNVAIVLTDKELADFVNDSEKLSACKKLYLGHDLLPDEKQEKAIENNEIMINIIPDYYYRYLQEG